MRLLDRKSLSFPPYLSLSLSLSLFATAIPHGDFLFLSLFRLRGFLMGNISPPLSLSLSVALSLSLSFSVSLFLSLSLSLSLSVSLCFSLSH